MRFIAVIIYLLLIAGIIWFQVYLSKRQNKWLGLILPGICIIISILAVTGFASYFSFTNVGITTIKENGEVVNEAINNTVNKNNPDIAVAIFSSIVMFLMFNIPTAIFLAIYAGCREKIKKNFELKKMNIQDLE